MNSSAITRNTVLRKEIEERNKEHGIPPYWSHFMSANRNTGIKSQENNNARRKTRAQEA